MTEEKNIKLEVIRHSLSHLMSMAIEEIYPKVGLGVGPAIDNGFYQDYDLPEAITPEILPKLEKRMREMIKDKIMFERHQVSLKEALEFYKHDPYKTEMIHGLKAAGEKKVSFYKSGFFDNLCDGPHVKSTREIDPEAFKLTKIAGAYWRGSEKNKMLTRIYGIAFATQAELDEYLKMMAEAEKRDHRKIGKEQELFFFDDLVGKGLPIWLPKGAIIRTEIEKLAIEKESQAGYERVVTPLLGKKELYITSGHLPYYEDSMYPAMEMDDGIYYLKAMNCPHHHLIFRSKLRSYRDLPLRLAEYGVCHRNELSGTLAGLLRVRVMTMNDAHIYCTQGQIEDEFKGVINLILDYFKIFGIKEHWFRLSEWDPKHTEKYINQPKNWKYSQNLLKKVLSNLGVKYTEAVDEAAFYGPKVDVQFKSALGREETLSTIQLDFLAKERFNLNYVDKDGRENNEVFVIHRAPLSVHERFSAFLIELYAGVWPVWLSPVQVKILSVGQAHIDYCQKLAAEFKQAGVRVEVDQADETVGNKIRKAVEEKIPYVLVIGDKEVGSDKLSVRDRGEKNTRQIGKKEFMDEVNNVIKEKK